MIILPEGAKQALSYLSFPRRRESRKSTNWIPACAGMTVFFINLDMI